MQKLPYPELIDDQSQISYSYSVLSCQFGDGYEQIAPNGINNEKRTWSVTYKNLPKPYFDKIIAFLRGLKGATPLLAKAPGENKYSQWRLVADSLQTSVTGISRLDQTEIVRSITFQLKSAYVIE